jgi:hypothetical protein
MNITEFKNILSANSDRLMRFILPNGKCIPAHYHITEVGHVEKNFIDCGGTIRTTSACVLQAWVAVNDEDHRLLAGKLASILKMADKILPSPDLPVEMEYEAPVISQFSINRAEVTSDEILFHLKTKRTDCLAKESCGLEGDSCGTDTEECCGAAEPIAQGEAGCC